MCFLMDFRQRKAKPLIKHEEGSFYVLLVKFLNKIGLYSSSETGTPGRLKFNGMGPVFE